VRRPLVPLTIVAVRTYAEYEESLWKRRERDYWHRRYLYQTTDEADLAVLSRRYRNIEAWLQRRSSPTQRPHGLAVLSGVRREA
jgi:hypothetical protein